jgi:Glyoxalase/Bleomycin resistance protein/Dioxygenase superfamily
MSEVKFAKINFLVRDAQSAFEYSQEVLSAEAVAQPHETPIGEIAQVRLHGLLMEFIQPPRGSRMDAMIDKRGEGIDSIGFVTDDVAGATAAIEARGGRFARPADSGLAATAWLHPKNPLSLSIELLSSEASELSD